jgi:hypothetical protein
MTRSAGSTKMVVSRNAPMLLTSAGVAGFIVTTALTIKATVKAAPLFTEIKDEVKANRAREVTEDFTERDKAAELGRLYGTHSLALLKVYGPALAVGSASILCVLASHGMMKNRQASLVAAYAALDTGYKAYRSRVAEVMGEENELALYRGVRTARVDDDEGQPCIIVDPNDPMPSPYAKFFDPCSPNWTKTPEYNLMFLRAQQDWANDKLRSCGYIFLNEIYQELGLERTQAGQIVGWKLNGNGDGFVDFGLYSIGDESSRAFVNGVEGTVLLDFNVDGPIRI